MVLPNTGMSPEAIFTHLDDLKVGDVRWRDGRAFTLVYYGGADVLAVSEEAYRRYSSENALNTDAFPSLRTIQTEVVAIVGDWLQAGDEGAGFMTSGGTESILLAVKAARERGRTERGVIRPNVVLPTSAHAAFEKGCYYFGVESRRIPVGEDWRADVAAMEAAIDDNTVLIVGSAPQYPQGVIDPITEIAALAASRNINCHVDACMGGVVLTYLARLGEQVPPWNFVVPGVTSISVDLHKYGYTAKGASVIMYRNKQLRSYQTYVTDNWLGGLYGSSGILGEFAGPVQVSAATLVGLALFLGLVQLDWLSSRMYARKHQSALANLLKHQQELERECLALDQPEQAPDQGEDDGDPGLTRNWPGYQKEPGQRSEHQDARSDQQVCDDQQQPTWRHPGMPRRRRAGVRQLPPLFT